MTGGADLDWFWMFGQDATDRKTNETLALIAGLGRGFSAAPAGGLFTHAADERAPTQGRVGNGQRHRVGTVVVRDEPDGVSASARPSVSSSGDPD